MPRILCLLAPLLLVIAACGTDHPSWKSVAPSEAADAAAASTEGGATRAGPGLVETGTGWRLTTDSYRVNPGEERYLCYVVSVPEDIVVGAIRSPDNPIVHHFLLVEPTVPEPEGTRECNVILELTWAPLYAATRANSALTMPPGAARTVKRGAQLLLQVHLSNTSDTVAYPSASVELETSKEKTPTEVGITLFGSTIIHVPAGEQKVVTNVCKTDEDLKLYAVLPHMHTIGKRLDLETAGPDGVFHPFYSRNPFGFDEQYFDPLERVIPAGTSVRISCTYDNTTSRDVEFGERSRDEMCFAIGFTIGGPSFQFCSAYKPSPGAAAPRDADAGTCVLTKSGLGQRCSSHGDECAPDLFCTADFFHQDTGLCFSIGCGDDHDCGVGNTCCTLPVLGNIANLCLPEACRPDYCVPTTREPR